MRESLSENLELKLNKNSFKDLLILQLKILQKSYKLTYPKRPPKRRP